ncbi:MAG: hypothetical protein DWQ04_25070 [Chloroflexi bacterium]|nr:MAG: hypothetical protein DWQ04_25070 [Chloroflexota bacterium]
MNILSIAIIIFIFLESLNVLTLYFNPGSQMGNGLGVFNAWEKSKADPEMHQFVRYLVFWVAGTKLIFIALLLVILLTAGESTQLLTVVAMIASISSFFWRLYPIIKSLDAENHITPPGYSKTLGMMIAGFIGLFAVALVWSLLAG